MVGVPENFTGVFDLEFFKKLEHSLLKEVGGDFARSHTFLKKIYR